MGMSVVEGMSAVVEASVVEPVSAVAVLKGNVATDDASLKIVVSSPWLISDTTDEDRPSVVVVTRAVVDPASVPVLASLDSTLDTSDVSTGRVEVKEDVL